MSPQVIALAAVTVLAGLTFAAARLWAARARSLVLAEAPARSHSEPYILYFSGADCTICRTHQEPALRQLTGIRVDKVDAIAETALAREYRVYTLPTTVVMSAEGRPLNVNYGYAPAARLRDQLRGAQPLAVARAG